MRRKWTHMFVVFLLTVGLLAGCAEKPGQPLQKEQSAGIQSAEEQSAGIQSGEEQNAGIQSAEEQNAGIQSAEEQSAGIQSAEEQCAGTQSAEIPLSEDGTYTSKEEVAEYIALYGHLPDNFITKKEAQALGWVSSKGNLGEVAPGKSIGGDYFGNFEGHLPEKKGRDYHECDIDSSGGYRGAKRIVYSNDGLIYYTEDHYETFELLYGEE